uniref:Adaptor related protein complex 3 subunit sigma 2 n=1 Tax=Buteo japonicus TaxID=224669 RepID=A0A8B9Z0A9_9AVES
PHLQLPGVRQVTLSPSSKGGPCRAVPSARAVSGLHPPSPESLHLCLCLCSLFGGSDYKLIYRHYATLYFVFCVDSSESELGILDLIQVFVETLDKCFENVCELDLIFHMDKVHHILQEVVIGGMVLETNMNEIVAQVEAQSKLEKAEGGLSAAPSRAVSAVKNINLPEIPRNINIGDINIKVPNLSQFM